MDDSEFIKCFFENFGYAGKHLFVKQKQEIESAIGILFDAWEKNSAVFIMGNGGSESTAKHFAADLAKTINDQPGARGIRAFTPWDNDPLISAIVNDRPKEDLFTAWLDTFYEEGGIGIGISVHGGSGSDVGGKWSQNLLKSLQFIKDRGGRIIGMSGYDGGPMKNLADVPIVVPVFEKSLGSPIVESWHVALHHLMAFALKRKIQERQAN